MNFKLWLHGLAAAAIGAFSSSITLVVIDPAKFNFSGEGFLSLAKVSLVSSIVAVAGYLAKSPLPEENQDQARKIGALFLCAILLMGTTTGCTAQDVATVVKNIGIYAQEAQPIVTQVITLITLLSATKDAGDLQQANAKIQDDLDALVKLCNTYNDHPSDSVWKQIVSTVDTLVTETDGSLLHFAGIKSDDSQKEALVALATVDALLHTIDGLVQSTEAPKEVKAKAFARSIKLQTISQYWSPTDKQQLAKTFRTNYETLFQYQQSLGY